MELVSETSRFVGPDVGAKKTTKALHGEISKRYIDCELHYDVYSKSLRDMHPVTGEGTSVYGDNGCVQLEWALHVVN